ncbi:hypothetical protein ACFQJC_02225 [Haloferax namakaokahaiae]|uniref:DUF7979 domain-containing protein n=1 Tax=Haloferax namakaokahaiae TaxID=1748331 RepID=A0ABD5ZBA4_9EURY
MPSRRDIVFLAVAVVCFAGAAAMPIWTVSSDVDYAVSVTPGSDGLSYDESDVVAYENLSAEAQHAFDSALAAENDTYVVDDENQTAPDLYYADDHVAVGHGYYPVRYDGVVYSLNADQRGGGIDILAFYQVYLIAPVLAALGVAFGLTGVYFSVRE